MVIGYNLEFRPEVWSAADGASTVVAHSAHEIGHAIGVDLHSENPIDLMFGVDFGLSPSRITRDKWREVQSYLELIE